MLAMAAVVLLGGCATSPDERSQLSTERDARVFANLSGVESPFCARGAHQGGWAGAAQVRALVEAAEQQHRLFGGQSIDADGRLVHAGFAEAESETVPGEATPTWVRVDKFWASVPRHDADSRVVRFQEGRSENLQAALRVNGANEMLRSSLIRAAAVDNPWSAAFISAMEAASGLDADAFAFSAAHADYVTQAAATSEAEAAGHADARVAYRACPLTDTAPQAGDLVCATRSDRSAFGSYGALVAGLAQRGRFHSGFPMHCEVVTRVDRKAGFLEAIGGNVVQSVTRRRLRLADDGSGRLSPTYASAAEQDRLCRAASRSSVEVAPADSHAPAPARQGESIDQADVGGNGGRGADRGARDNADRSEAGACRRQPSLNDLSWVVLLQRR